MAKAALPDDFRTWTNEQLITFARENFSTEIRGSKTQLIEKLEGLSKADDTPPPTNPDNPPPSQQDGTVLPSGTVANMNPQVPQDPEVKEYNSIDLFAKYPSIKWLKDDHGRVFKADLPLLKTFDLDKNMIPCGPPDYYIGSIGYHGTDPRKPASE